MNRIYYLKFVYNDFLYTKIFIIVRNLKKLVDTMKKSWELKQLLFFRVYLSVFNIFFKKFLSSCQNKDDGEQN